MLERPRPMAVSEDEFGIGGGGGDNLDVFRGRTGVGRTRQVSLLVAARARQR